MDGKTAANERVCCTTNIFTNIETKMKTNDKTLIYKSTLSSMGNKGFTDIQTPRKIYKTT